MIRHQWTCDGCDQQEVVDDGGVPHGWLKYLVRCGTFSRDDWDVDVTAQLCPACVKRLRETADPRKWPRPVRDINEQGAEMTAEELRLEALKIANFSENASPAGIVARAAIYYAFLRNEPSVSKNLTPMTAKARAAKKPARRK